MRLNKFIGESGACSRREADKWIEQGRVSINGVTAVLGTQVNEGDQVCIDGQPIGAKKRPVYLALNKPVGITCTADPRVEGNIIEFVGHPERIFPIGRLDKDSEGLILLTNDGDIVNGILRANYGHEKEYIVELDRPITDLSIDMLSNGVKILGVMTKPCKVWRVNQRTVRMILTQGLNRQIRRMCSALGYQVRRLQRVRIMNVHLGQMGVGKWRLLTDAEVKGLARPALAKQRGLDAVGPESGAA
jgi:23S rRNA pseudouridine2604 synthase